MYSILIATTFLVANVGAVVQIDSDLLKFSKEDVVYQRYLVLEDIDDKDGCKAMISFVLNTVSLKDTILVPQFIDKSKNIVRFDLRDYGILPKNYDSLGKDNYIKGDDNIKKLTQAINPIMRADVFIMRAVTAPYYYKFIGASNLNEFKKRHNYSDPKSIESEQAAVVVTGNLARNTRYVKRLSTTGGIVYESRDSISVDYLLDLFSEKYDSIQILAFNPNGLISYFSADTNNKATDYLDPKISVDHANFFGSDLLVRNARNCVACHSLGVVQIDDKVRKIMKEGITLHAVDKKMAERLTDLFGEEIPVQKDQKVYVKALKSATDLNPNEFVQKFVNVWKSYYNDLTFKQAAKELKFSEKDFEEFCKNSGNIYLLKLFLNGKIARANLDRFLEEK